MPSYLDLALIVVVLISALLSMLRGFTREVLAIISWAAAAAAAFYFYPLGVPYILPYTGGKDQIAMGISAAAIFFLTLIVVSIITVKISDMILDSKIGALDRSLGFLFGAGRGLLLCVVAFLFFGWLVPEKAQPEWVKTAKTRPLLSSSGEQLMAMMPDDVEAFLQRLKRNKAGEDAPADGEKAAPSAPPAKPGPAPAKKS
jgi:membrane protein required for colicin V production